MPPPPLLTLHFYFPLELYVFIYQLIILWTIWINWHRWLLVNNHISKYNSFILVLYRRYINYVSVCPPPPPPHTHTHTFWHLPAPLLMLYLFGCCCLFVCLFGFVLFCFCFFTPVCLYDYMWCNLVATRSRTSQKCRSGT